MGFADLSIADIAAEYDLADESVLSLCDQLGISYKDRQKQSSIQKSPILKSRLTTKTTLKP